MLSVKYDTRCSTEESRRRRITTFARSFTYDLLGIKTRAARRGAAQRESARADGCPHIFPDFVCRRRAPRDTQAMANTLNLWRIRGGVALIFVSEGTLVRSIPVFHGDVYVYDSRRGNL